VRSGVHKLVYRFYKNFFRNVYGILYNIFIDILVPVSGVVIPAAEPLKDFSPLLPQQSCLFVLLPLFRGMSNRLIQELRRRKGKRLSLFLARQVSTKPRLPLVCVPGMFLQHCFYLVDGLGVFLVQYLVSNSSREHMGGNIPGRSGKGNTASVRSTRDATSDTVASYAISDEQGARKNALDNRQ
jgi:hypothetical protein